MRATVGLILRIYIEGGTTKGEVDVDGVIMHIPLFLLSDARVGDEVFIDSGIAIGRIESDAVNALSWKTQN